MATNYYYYTDLEEHFEEYYRLSKYRNLVHIVKILDSRTVKKIRYHYVKGERKYSKFYVTDSEYEKYLVTNGANLYTIVCPKPKKDYNTNDIYIFFSVCSCMEDSSPYINFDISSYFTTTNIELYYVIIGHNIEDKIKVTINMVLDDLKNKKPQPDGLIIPVSLFGFDSECDYTNEDLIELFKIRPTVPRILT